MRDCQYLIPFGLCGTSRSAKVAQPSDRRIFSVPSWRKSVADRYNRRFVLTDTGEVVEWSIAPDSKSGTRFCRVEGSNPSLSANLKAHLFD